MFRMNPTLDVGALAKRYREEGAVVVDNWLDGDGAAALATHLRSRKDWRQIVSSGQSAFELDRETRAALSETQARQLDDAVYAGARTGFQYRFETLRVPDEQAARESDDSLLAAFASWISQGEALSLLRGIVGRGDVAFCDAQGTAYAPGDFLTGHDDAVAGKHRVAAYVFGLSVSWRAEWGGLLLFHDSDGPDGGRVSGIVPGFNRLSLFRVPRLHSVSEVSRAAPHRRYSVTGWLRTAR